MAGGSKREVDYGSEQVIEGGAAAAVASDEVSGVALVRLRPEGSG